MLNVVCHATHGTCLISVNLSAALLHGSSSILVHVTCVALHCGPLLFAGAIPPSAAQHLAGVPNISSSARLLHCTAAVVLQQPGSVRRPMHDACLLQFWCLQVACSVVALPGNSVIVSVIIQAESFSHTRQQTRRTHQSPTPQLPNTQPGHTE